MSNLSDSDATTHAAICDPMVGDYFHEMMSYTCVVLDVSDEVVTIFSGGGNNTREIVRYTKEAFKKYLSYTSSNLADKYWVSLYERDFDTSQIVNYDKLDLSKYEIITLEPKNSDPEDELIASLSSCSNRYFIDSQNVSICRKSLNDFYKWLMDNGRIK